MNFSGRVFDITAANCLFNSAERVVDAVMRDAENGNSVRVIGRLPHLSSLFVYSLRLEEHEETAGAWRICEVEACRLLDGVKSERTLAGLLRMVELATPVPEWVMAIAEKTKKPARKVALLGHTKVGLGEVDAAPLAGGLGGLLGGKYYNVLGLLLDGVKEFRASMGADRCKKWAELQVRRGGNSGVSPRGPPSDELTNLPRLAGMINDAVYKEQEALLTRLAQGRLSVFDTDALESDIFSLSADAEVAAIDAGKAFHVLSASGNIPAESCFDRLSGEMDRVQGGACLVFDAHLLGRGQIIGLLDRFEDVMLLGSGLGASRGQGTYLNYPFVFAEMVAQMRSAKRAGGLYVSPSAPLAPLTVAELALPAGNWLSTPGVRCRETKPVVRGALRDGLACYTGVVVPPYASQQRVTLLRRFCHVSGLAGGVVVWNPDRDRLGKQGFDEVHHGPWELLFGKHHAQYYTPLLFSPPSD